MNITEQTPEEAVAGVNKIENLQQKGGPSGARLFYCRFFVLSGKDIRVSSACILVCHGIPFVAPVFKYARHHGNNDNRDNDQREILFDRRNAAEEKTRKQKKTNPGDAADNIVGDEPRVFHSPDAGDKRGEGADDGNKAGDNDGFAAVFFVELMRSD